jgi:hypothetical protein
MVASFFPNNHAHAPSSLNGRCFDAAFFRENVALETPIVETARKARFSATETAPKTQFLTGFEQSKSVPLARFQSQNMSKTAPT